MNEGVQRQIVEALSEIKLPGIEFWEDWTGIPDREYSSHTCLTRSVVFIPPAKLSDRPCRYAVADQLAEKLNKVGLTFKECDQLSLFYSFIIAHISQEKISRIPKLVDLIHFLDSRAVTEGTINFKEPSPVSSGEQSEPGILLQASPVFRDYEKRFKKRSSTYTPEGIEVEAIFTVPDPVEARRRSISGNRKTKNISKKKKTTLRKSKHSLHPHIEASAEYQINSDEETTDYSIISHPILTEASFLQSPLFASPDFVHTKTDLFRTAPLDQIDFNQGGSGSQAPISSTASESLLETGFEQELESESEFEYETMATHEAPDKSPESTPARKKPRKEKSGVNEEENDKEDEVMSQGTPEPIPQNIVAGDAPPPPPPGGGDDDDDDGGGGPPADERDQWDRGGRDKLVPNILDQDSDILEKAAFSELSSFVINPAHHSVLIPLEVFVDMVDGQANVQFDDINLANYQVTDDNFISDINYAEQVGQVVRTDTPSHPSPLPRSSTLFLYRQDGHIYVISPSDYAVYWSVAFTLNGNTPPTRNMIIILASYQPLLSRGRKIIKSSMGELVCDHATVRVVTSNIISRPWGASDSIINEEYLREVSSGWNLLDKNLQEMRKGCKFAGFDIDQTIVTALTKYRNGEGKITKVEARNFVLDLKIVALVTYMRGYSLEKIFIKWEDQMMLDRFKGICSKLGIKSTRTDSPAKDELTLSRVPLLVPYAQPKFCLQDPEPGVVQIKKIPKSSHCGSFCGLVPELPEWQGVFISGICYAIFQDTIINKKAKKQQKVTTLISYADIARGAASKMTDEQKVRRMRMLGVTAEIQSRLMSLVPSIMSVSEELTKNALGVVKAALLNLPDIWE